MGIPITDIISRVSDVLLDDKMVRWTLAERVRWANEAMGAILNRRPAAFAARVIVALVAGTAQAAPVGSSIVLDVVRNMGADGTTPGRVIRRSDRQLLDDSDPDWHTGAPSTTTTRYTYDDRTPTLFYVYPPAVAGRQVELMVAALPAPVPLDTTGILQIGGEYMEAIINYVCYRCKSKDSETGQASDATLFYNAFQTCLAEKSAAATTDSPNQPSNSV